MTGEARDSSGRSCFAMMKAEVIRMKALSARTLLVLLVFVICTASAACIIGGRREWVTRPGELDFKLGPFTYLEEGKLIGLAVGTEAARYREKEKYMPVALGIANKNSATLKLSRESFVLQDENGRRYPLATLSELSEGYGLGSMDRTLTTFGDIFQSHFPTYNRVESNFFPDRVTRGIVVDRLELPRFHFMIDLLYFPKPDDGILGRRFELHVNAPGLQDEVFVKFLVD